MICPYCKEEKDVIKRGIRKNKFIKKQQYWCNKCMKYFIEHDGFEGMTYPKEIIVKTLHLYVEGLSLSKIRDYINQHEGYYLHDSTILYWVNKYANLLSKFENSLNPKVKGRIHTDDVQIKVKGKRYYSINSIDSKTKYNLGTTFTKHRSKRKCREHFKNLKKQIGCQVKEVCEKEKNKPVKERKLITFVSDGFEGYKIGFNYHFYRIAKLTFGVPIACKKHGLNYNNNAIERHNEDFRQRSNIMRGFKSQDSGSAFTELRRIVYNFVRTHQGLGKTPADEAELKLQLGNNKLLGLISLSNSLFGGFGSTESILENEHAILHVT
jgi:transposase-like protein